MAKSKGGTIVAPTGDRKTWGLRVTAYGKRHWVPLGSSEEGWNRDKAQRELDRVVAEVHDGTWRPDAPKATAPVEVHTFEHVAQLWFDRGVAGGHADAGWREKTIEANQWALDRHLLPWFGDVAVDAIDMAAIDAYVADQVRKGRLSPKSINKTLSIMASVMEEAIDYGWIPSNPAASKRHRLKTRSKQQVYLRPEQVPIFLDSCTREFRPVAAVMLGAGLRISEACALNWADVNLKAGTLTVRESKTDTGAGRVVDLPNGLLEELENWKRDTPGGTRLGDPVLVNRQSRDGKYLRLQPRNALARINGVKWTKKEIAQDERRKKRSKKPRGEKRVEGAVDRANPRLAEFGIDPIEPGLGCHGCRRTWATLRSLTGEDEGRLLEQGGWRHKAELNQWYRQATTRLERMPADHAQQYQKAIEWSTIGEVEHETTTLPKSQAVTETQEIKVQSKKHSSQGRVRSGATMRGMKQRPRQDSNLGPTA